MVVKSDVLGRVQAAADHITMVEQDYPDLHILAGDFAFVKTADSAAVGVLIVANIDGQYAVRRHDGEFEVHGLVVGVFRGLT